MTIQENIDGVRRRVVAAAGRAGRDPEQVAVIGAIKGTDAPAIRAAIEAGLTQLGENQVQEASAHREALGAAASGATWHLIGHLQRNKAAAALRLFDTIQSVDSLRLAELLNERAGARFRVLLEVNVAGEASKYGIEPAAVASTVSAVGRLTNLDLGGLMTVAPVAVDAAATRAVFRQLRELAQANGLDELSMGMTDDFEVAVEEGATLVRVGRAIFGERNR